MFFVALADAGAGVCSGFGMGRDVVTSRPPAAVIVDVLQHVLSVYIVVYCCVLFVLLFC